MRSLLAVLISSCLVAAATADPSPARPPAAEKIEIDLHLLGLLRPGALVRVDSLQLRGETVVGRLTSIDDEVLRLEIDDVPPPVALTRASIRKLEVANGTRSQAGEGATLGAWVFGGGGAGLGFAAGAMGNLDCEGHCSNSLPIVSTVVGAAAGVTVGGLLGGLVGSAGETENWQTVEKRTVAVHVGPGRRGGVAASVSIGF